MLLVGNGVDPNLFSCNTESDDEIADFFDSYDLDLTFSTMILS